MSDHPELRTTRLSFDYGGRPAIQDINMSVHGGEILGVLGPNGAGKSTLMKCLSGCLKPMSGQINLCHQSIESLPLWRRSRLGLGYLPQSCTLLPELSVLQNLALGLSRKKTEVDAAVILRNAGLEDYQDHKPSQLSGGQQRQVELARIFAMGFKVVLLDEPFAGIDPKGRQQICRQIRAFQSSGCAVVVADHNVEATLDLVCRAVVLVDGKVCCEGNRAKILQDDAVRAHYLGEGHLADRDDSKEDVHGF